MFAKALFVCVGLVILGKAQDPEDPARAIPCDQTQPKVVGNPLTGQIIGESGLSCMEKFGNCYKCLDLGDFGNGISGSRCYGCRAECKVCTHDGVGNLPSDTAGSVYCRGMLDNEIKQPQQGICCNKACAEGEVSCDANRHCTDPNKPVCGGGKAPYRCSA
mmetsp:Transcript_35639/g.57241  ORF Transcript_35639/g.57241 Transcript_35639/m.57241 type:complete len:161 (-) Transcript_35639:208-690(-)